MPLSSEQVQQVLSAAKAAAKHAYCPYSRFTVGAAVLAEDGKIDSGSNVENASFGLTICAERNAIFQMSARGARKIELVAIYTPTESPTAPCGACRQVINEFGPNARIISFCDGPDRIETTLDQLLPHAFGPEMDAAKS